MIIGVIADDVTGASDVALMLARAGCRTIQIIGVPKADHALPDADAIVVALKSRTAPVAEAVSTSLAACDALLRAGARQILFKVCSTFDSTPAGNIGPVADALLTHLGAASALVCPAFPRNGRTVYQGYLFVGAQPLHESPMKNHPLTPMRDSNLMRLLGQQSQFSVGLAPFAIVAAGEAAVREAVASAERAGERYLVADAITDENLLTLGLASAEARLLVGGSGIALGLPAAHARAGRMTLSGTVSAVAAPNGRAVILAGSCSAATRGQVAHAIAQGVPALRVDPLQLLAKAQSAQVFAKWAVAQPASGPVLIYSTAEPQAVAALQETLGREKAGAMVEQALGETARLLVAQGFTRLIAAGGETSGAVLEAIGARALAIGPEIDPGVPWMQVVDGPAAVIALKSGNFGAPDFFTAAWGKLA